MGRPAKHREDDFIDAAATLFAEGGARAVTMSAVARAVGAPSGSVYHRFADRPALLAAVWTTTLRAFHAGYLDALGPDPSPRSVAAAGEWIVRWCGRAPGRAAVLHAGVRAFEPDSWSEQARADLAAIETTQQRIVASIVDRLAETTGLPADQLAFAVIDLPLAAVRRHLLAGQAPPASTGTLVRHLTERLLRPR
ncbi:MAG TPA: TetR/AcrR family transcriptional regulator [Nocardia sp.]|uniref:TetR/AcrR family transcriptional regulator n=1 Tax=Nocardia TaxID=1817 RepID=UPI0024544270|nr:MULTISPECIES: TetR/AcrR family transcriptional regulator [Nocardia]HLS79724.1 TetR/AcrR family transcriptional regulator [Nocardia sp.]